MENREGQAWRIRDPERFNARFRVINQMYNIAQLSKNGARPADLKVYAKECPAEADKLAKLQTVGKVSGVSAVLGLLASSTAIWRWSKTPPLVLVGGILGAVSGAVASEDVASLALGTYKFDNHKAIEDFYIWINQRDGAKLTQQ